jgi:hypothetical protein
MRISIYLLSIMLAPAAGFSQTIKPTAQSHVPAATAPVLKPVPYFSGAVNYVRSWTPQIEIVDPALLTSPDADRWTVQVQTQYQDGLARPIQTVSRSASPEGMDLVSSVYYDEFGRESHKFLPFQPTSNSGSFRMDPFADQADFYSGSYLQSQPAIRGESHYYSKTITEESPLGRPVKTFAPGNSWVGSEGSASEKAVSRKYEFNSVADNVFMWNMAINAGQDDIPQHNFSYGAGKLYKTTTTDESGKSVVEYKDLSGNIILRKVQIDDQPGISYDGWLCTYYVYDDYGLLRFVIPPKAVTQVLLTGSVSSDVARELCFQYLYDSRFRMIAKHIPGAGWAEMVYDERDRLVFSRDANQMRRAEWSYFLYDRLNRPVVSGLMSSALEAVDMMDFINSSEELATINVGGSPMQVSLYPLIENEDRVDLTITYYDDYENWNTRSFDQSIFGHYDTPLGDRSPTTESLRTRLMATGTKVRALEFVGSMSDMRHNSWIEAVQYFDEKGRPIQKRSNNFVTGEESFSTWYDFTGKTIQTLQAHSNPMAGTQFNILTETKYDHAGRLLEIDKTVNDDPETKRQVVRNSYDELGNLLTKSLGNKTEGSGNTVVQVLPDPMETLRYAQNIRGWLKGINWNYEEDIRGTKPEQSWFAMDLSYDWGYSNNQFAGNIAGSRWFTKGSGAERSYGYRYDGANRLLLADFAQRITPVNWARSYAGFNIDFSTTMGDGSSAATAYDENGNIRQMQQWGMKLNQAVQVDNLWYAYENNGISNKLQAVVDLNNDPQTSFGDFRTSAGHPQAPDKTSYVAGLTGLPQEQDLAYFNDYKYDSNGNMIEDENKDILVGGIEYNHLNLPYRIRVQNADRASEKGVIEYVYDATGNKLRKTVTENGNPTVTDYVSGFVYENNNLMFLGHEEGRVRVLRVDANDPSSSIRGWAYDYFIKDHLGSVRVVLTDEQRQDLYPAATLETAKRSIEETYYQIDGNQVVDASAVNGLPNYPNNNGLPNNPPDPTFETANSQKLYKLNGSNHPIGLGMTLKVMAGDKLDIRGYSYYPGAGQNTPSNLPLPINTLLAAFLGSPGVVPGGHGALQPSDISGSASGVLDFLQQPLPAGTAANYPRAFINCIFFDEQMRYVGGVSSLVSDANQLKDHAHDLAALPVPRNGYAFVYCSNESTQNVYFDNIQVVHTRGPLTEETHYYPFGLVMKGISSKAVGIRESNKRFQNQEFAHEEFADGSGLEMYEFKYRMDDIQIGRFWQVDPLSDKYVYNSTYAFSENCVTNNVELEGLEKAEVKLPGNTPPPTNTWPPKPPTMPDCLKPKKAPSETPGPPATGGNPSPGKSSNNEKQTETTGGFTLKLKGTAALKVGAVASGEIEGLGFNASYHGVDFLGMRDNEFYFAGRNTDGEQVDRNQVDGGICVVGMGYQTETRKAKNGTTTQSETISVRTFGFFVSEVTTNKATGESVSTNSIDISGALGIGMVVEAGIRIIFSEETTKKK